VLNLFFYLLFIAIIAFTIYGAVAAGQNGDTWWMVSMIVGGLLAIGWLPAAVYLLAVKPSRSLQSSAVGQRHTGIPPGWHQDPHGRH
jgi:hypothetical protein